MTASPEEAIEFLAQLDRHGGIHTYQESAERTSQGTDAEGRWTVWQIVERPAFGPFHYRIHFENRTTRTSATSIVGRVRPAPGCTLHTRSTAQVTDAGTRIVETVTVTAPRLLLGYMTRHTVIAHSRMFELLPGELGDEPERAV